MTIEQIVSVAQGSNQNSQFWVQLLCYYSLVKIIAEAHAVYWTRN